MELNLKVEIKNLLNEKVYKSSGVHVKDITNHIVNEHNNLFSLINLKDRDKLQARINSLLLYDINKKSGNIFSKVKNPKTGKDKKGFYKIRSVKRDRQIPQPNPLDYPIPTK